MPNLIEKITVSILQNDYSENRKRWAKYIVEENINFNDLIPLLLADKHIASRFSWILGDITEIKPEIISPVLTKIFNLRNKVKFQSFERSLAKMFFSCGIPEKIEGKVTNLLFEWLVDPNIIVSTKYYSMLALARLTKKYPELKNELLITINDQIKHNSIGFKKGTEKVYKIVGEL